MKISKISKFLIPFFIGFTLILTISFLWGEKIYFNSIYQINDTKFGNYFTSIGAIGTMVSLVFLYLQLKEMEKQRNESIKPDLYPLLTTFSMQEIIDANGNVHIFPKEIDFITIKNIGLGAAKEISIKWNYDSIEIEKIINGKYDNSKPEVLENDYHDIIIKEGEIQIKPPYYYLSCCGSKIDLDFFDLFETESKPKPKLNLEIIYITIGDITIKSNFNVEIVAYKNNITFKFLRIEST